MVKVIFFLLENTFAMSVTFCTLLGTKNFYEVLLQVFKSTAPPLTVIVEIGQKGLYFLSMALSAFMISHFLWLAILKRQI